MGAIAKGEITITTVNDAYTMSLSPETCVINADFSGNPYNLSSIAPTLTIKRGDRTIPFSIVNFHANQCIVRPSMPNINSTYDTVRFLFTRILNGALSGGFEVEIKTEDGYDFRTKAQFTFSVVRESTMLDWIQDWNDNMTRISGSYILTPKIFIGKREDVVETVEIEDIDSYTETIQWKEGALTGVYIGPDLLASGESSAGIYGYLRSEEIFHLNGDGGMIAGWTFNHEGLFSPISQSGGSIQILSEGSITSRDDSATHWGLYADGSATFANGNVTFQPNGDASFNGSITSNSGTIGGWNIENHGLYNGPILLDAANRYIGIASSANWNIFSAGDDPSHTVTRHKYWVENHGGIAMYWRSGADYGMVAYNSVGKVVQLGSTNEIAGWTISSDSIYIGTKNNSQGGFATDGITIGTNGLRGQTWNIDTNGHASFANEKVKFNADGTASIASWTITESRLSTKHTALVSGALNSGLFITSSDISDVADMGLLTTISQNGGIVVGANTTYAWLEAKDKDGNTCFHFTTNGSNNIGEWTFDHQSIYKGLTTVDEDGFVGEDCILLSTEGLRGNKWKLLADGSGAIAGGNISWDADGAVTFGENVSLSWANISDALGYKLTQIDANGVYTGTVSANKISAGTIIGSTIKESATNPVWEINANGSGFFAKRAIIWDSVGNIAVNAGITAKTLTLGDGSSIVVTENQKRGVILPKLGGSSMKALEVWVFDQSKLYLKAEEIPAERGFIRIGENILHSGEGSETWVLESGMYRIVGINVIHEENNESDEVTYWNIVKYSKAYDLETIPSPHDHTIPENQPFGTLPVYDHIEQPPSTPNL